MARFNRVSGFNSSVKAAMSPIMVTRMRFLTFTIVQGANTGLPLMTCDDDPDYDQLIDGTTPGECQPGSRILGIQMHLQLLACPVGEVLEWVLLKDPDGVLLGASTNNIATLYTQDKTTSSILIRKYALAAGHVIVDATSRSVQPIIVNIPRKTLMRIGPMQENDNLRMVFTLTAAASNADLYGRGRIIWRQG